MRFFGFLGSVEFCLLVALAAATPAAAQWSHFDSNTGVGGAVPDQKDAVFYRSFAKPMRGQIQKVPEAGTWLFETDKRTKIAYPRVVHLLHNQPVNKVNEALAAIHGRMIRLALENDRLVGGYREPGSTNFQRTVKVTYFSPRYLSIVELGAESSQGSGTSIFARGITVDIERGAISSVEACGPDSKRPTFSFGSLLAMCTEAALAPFLDLWKTHAEFLEVEVPKDSVPRGLQDCWGRSLAYFEHASFALYLTKAGLAVHNVGYVSNSETQCIDDDRNPFNPVIIPYRELEPFMQPGLLHDELLK